MKIKINQIWMDPNHYSQGWFRPSHVEKGILSFFFSGRLLSVLRGHSVFSSPPQRPMTSDFEGFLYRILSITLFSYLNSWEREPVVPFSMFSAKQGNYLYHFISSLVWRGPWLGIEPETPALEASTLPLGYRGGVILKHQVFFNALLSKWCM